MIGRIEIDGIHYQAGDDIKKYVRKKIGRLDRYMPRYASKSVHAQVKLIDEHSKSTNKYTCEVILHFKRANLNAKESTLNMFAAVDIVEAKLKNQLRKHKERHDAHHTSKRNILLRLKTLGRRSIWDS